MLTLYREFTENKFHKSYKCCITSRKAYGSVSSSLASKWYAFKGPKTLTISRSWKSSIKRLVTKVVDEHRKRRERRSRWGFGEESEVHHKHCTYLPFLRKEPLISHQWKSAEIQKNEKHERSRYQQVWVHLTFNLQYRLTDSSNKVNIRHFLNYEGNTLERKVNKQPSYKVSVMLIQKHSSIQKVIVVMICPLCVCTTL